MENSDCPGNNKRRLTLRPCVSSKWIGSQRLNFLSLPEDIVSRITAELTLKEAGRMSVICSQLRRAWIYHPNLDFGISTVPGSGISTVRSSKNKRNQSCDRHKRILSIKRFIDTVNFILREHSGLAVNRIAVKFELRKEQANDNDGWVSFAIASKAKVVILDFSPYLGLYENNYSFPYYLFNNQNASHLQVLRLDSVTLGPSPDICGFANLTTLSLVHVLMLQDLQYFLLKCPALESLSIRLCSQLHNLHAAEPLHRGGSKVLIALHKCLKLKTVSIAFLVEENLEYVFTGLPNGLSHVETLHVRVTVITQIHGFTQAPLKFIYLRHLIMEITFSNDKRFGKNAVLQLAYLLEAAPFLADLHLDILCISCCGDRPKGDVISDHPHYNLKRACITGYNGNGGQVALVKYILRNAVQLERMVIDPRGERPIGEYRGRISAKSKLIPKDKNSVLTIL